LASLVWFYVYHTLDWGFRQIGRTASFASRHIYPALGLLAASGVFFNLGLGNAVPNGTLDGDTGDSAMAATAASAKIEWADMVIVSGVVVGAATFLFRKTLFGGKG
ncbi:hypothetical protein GGF42_009281, partial [Coemansia sp. RSA 2424]